MPFKIVSTVEDGKIMIVAIPQNWEKNGILYWPNLKGPLVEKERKNGNSMPQAGWSQQACKVKSYGLENYLEARNMEKTFSSLTDTEAEEKYEQKQRTKRKHPGYLKQQNEIPSVNHMFPKPNRKPSSEYAFCPDNELDSRSSIELPNEPLNNNNLSTQLQSFSIERNIDAGTESSVVLDLDQILSNSAKCDSLLLKLDELTLKFDTMTKKIDYCLDDNARINVKLDNITTILNKNYEVRTNLTPSNLLTEFEFPLKVHEDIENMESKLLDKSFKHQLVSKLAQIGGTSGSEDGIKVAHKVMNFLFDYELLTKYSWTGTSKKINTSIKFPFLKYTNIIEMLHFVINQADSRYTKIINEDFLKNKCLKHTALRLSRKRKNQNKPEKVTENIILPAVPIKDNILQNLSYEELTIKNNLDQFENYPEDSEKTN